MPEHKYSSLIELIESCRTQPPLRTAVVYPCSEVSLGGAVQAAKAGIIKPILVGPVDQIRPLAASLSINLAGMDFLEAPNAALAAEFAARLAATGGADALMKGSLDTAELMARVVHPDSGLRMDRRVSHANVMHVPAYAKLLLLTDAAINVAPNLEEKADIVRNVIDLAHALGIARPKVAILSAIEFVRPSIPDTLDAAALCKMADRGQITGAILDGPLAFDDAVSKEAARIKRIQSPVAGDADVLVAPDLDAANMLFKEMHLFSQAEEAGIVLGARVPVILTSRADGVSARIASCAVAACYARANNQAGAQGCQPSRPPSLKAVSLAGVQP